MKAIRALFASIFFISLAVATVPVVADSVGPSVIVAQVQTGASASASQEYVSLYNNTAQDVEVTGWCLFYNTSTTKPGCIEAPEPGVTVWLQAHSYATFASTQFVTAHSGFTPQARASFSGGLSDSGGTLTLFDSDGVVRDRFSWSSKAASDMIYQRLTSDSTTLQYTADNSIDFVQTALVIPDNIGLYEQQAPIDVCPNIPDLQTIVPEGFLQDSAGDCRQDICPNIPDLQMVLPADYELTTGGLCSHILLESAPLSITELLPNVSGSDTGNEFVELHNPLDRPVQLTGYILQLGPAFTETYTFTAGVIEPGQYSVFSDTALGITLPNTTASLRLVAPDGAIVSTTDIYQNPADDRAWALIAGTWQYTDLSTPAAPNQAQVDSVVSTTSIPTAPEPCPAGKYRNLDTNRCRTLQATATVTACGANQYRNLATNRCRNIMSPASSTLTPCGPDQERNPTTNRCRKVATATGSTLQPCDDGQERNPDTNRCHKVLSASSTNAKQDDSEAGGSRTINIFIVASVVAGLLGYAAYEYRYDLQNVYLRIRHKQR